MIKNYGLVLPEKIETREQGAEHLLGALKKPVINPSGDWSVYWPHPEAQKRRNVETYGCTVWATLNATEAEIKRQTGKEVNYTDRYLANVAKFKGILNPSLGADPHKIAELVRVVSGCLREDRLPWSDDIKTTEDYYDVQNLAELMKEGYEWYKLWTFNHEWIFKGGDKELELKDALLRGPVCVSVVAWQYDDENGWYWKEPKQPDGHWTGLMRYDGDKPIIGDSYPESEGDFEKVLAPNYDFGFAKVYYLTPVTTPSKQELSIFQKIINAIRQLIEKYSILIERKSEEDKIKINPDEAEVLPPPAPPIVPKYLWDTPTRACHSVRVICDEEKLSVADKNLIAQVINCESGFNPKAINRNSNGTLDAGIAQFNTGKNKDGVPYWIGEGAVFPSVEFVLNNPEACVREMIRQFKKGNLKYWICFKNGGYTNFPSKVA